MIIKFADKNTQGKFLALAEAQRQDISQLLKPLNQRPVVVANDLNQEQTKWVAENLGPAGKAFSDVQFEPFQ